MVSIAMKTHMASDVQDAGFTRVFRTTAEQQVLTALYEKTAETKTPSLDLDRLNRADLAGNKQVDGGYQIFTAISPGAVSSHQEMVSPQDLAKSLELFGYHLAVAEVFQREGDEAHLKLRLTWSTNSPAHASLTQKQQTVVDKYLGLAYFKLFGFYNLAAVSLAADQSPISGSIVTLNFTGVAPKAAERFVRMTDQDGHLRCEPRATEVFLGDASTQALADRAFSPASRPDDKAFIRSQSVRCPERKPRRLAVAAQDAPPLRTSVAGKPAGYRECSPEEMCNGGERNPGGLPE